MPELPFENQFKIKTMVELAEAFFFKCYLASRAEKAGTLGAGTEPSRSVCIKGVGNLG